MSSHATSHRGYNYNTAPQAKKHDWGMFFGGILLAICAFVIMLWPGATLVSMAIFAGIMLLFAGGVDISVWFRTRGMESGSGWILLNAILDILLGAMFVIHPIASAQVLPWLAGVFVIGYGIVACVTAVAVRGVGSMWGLALLAGILSIVVGIFFFVSPAYFVYCVGLYLAIRGIEMCVYGIVAPRSLPYM